MTRSRRAQRLRALPARTRPERGKTRSPRLGVTPRGLIESPCLVALHASPAPEQAYRALRGLFRERMGPSFAVLVLKALPGDPAVAFDGGLLGAHDRDLAEWLVRLD